MDIMGIVLLTAGAVICIASFLIPAERERSPERKEELAREEIKRLLSTEMGQVRGQVDDTVEEAVGQVMEKTERSLERLSNEKIMAVNEYSDTVLAEINRNHQEVMFLYDMLQNKHVNLKNTVSEVERKVREAREAAKGAQEATREAELVMPAFQALKEKALSSYMVNPGGEKNHTVQKTTAKSTEEAGDIIVEKPVVKKASVIPVVAKKTVEIPAAVKKPDVKREAEGQADRFPGDNEMILTLHRQGKAAVDIARELGLGVGEVKLVIDLYKGME